MARNNEVRNPRHIIVSGGARGLGLAIVRRLLNDGYHVSTFSRRRTEDMDELATEHPKTFCFLTCDMMQLDEIAPTVDLLRERLGKVYGLVNNAATVQEGILATLPEVEIGRMIQLNLDATIRLTRACVKDMLFESAGRVINISSIIGTRGYNGLTVYSATKAGLDGFTRALAREVGRRQVTVNSIGPGYMKTDMSAGLSGERLNQIMRRTPLGRLATPDDISPLVSFLASEAASFITGETILVDGGISN